VSSFPRNENAKLKQSSRTATKPGVPGKEAGTQAASGVVLAVVMADGGIEKGGTSFIYEIIGKSNNTM
jgi:hypothetical protein